MATARPRHTYADYLGVEMMKPGKHEFFNGEIYAMSGGSEDHAALAVKLTVALDRAVGDGPCRVYSSDLRIYVEAVGMAAFPDASVLCEPLSQHAASPEATALNPSILVEVTSPSSEAYDCETKLMAYQTIASLHEYVIVSHRERRITVHYRTPDGWKLRSAITGGRVVIPSLETELVVDEIYRSSSIR
ncbi:MAG TPA: Uma2 family endonuclease [Kofleriaceae bacterium]|jgi:Uma2 family endonuclease|nr:Uma2 family endonuclease [Kofleriaceae bacterium]